MDQLRIPGPTPIPDNILQPMSKQMVDHRGKVVLSAIKEALPKAGFIK